MPGAARQWPTPLTCGRRLDGLLASRRDEPRDDIASTLLSDTVRSTLSYEEARALAANLIFGGLDATAKAITTGVFQLLDHDHWTGLAAAPEQIGHAVAELLRFTPPSTAVGRYVPHDLECRGVQLRAGQVVSANLDAACRDPRRYPDPDTLDPPRESGRDLAFGAGPHYCIGAHVAKLGLRVALATLTQRFPAMTLAGGPDEVLWEFDGFQGVVSLPVHAGAHD